MKCNRLVPAIVALAAVWALPASGCAGRPSTGNLAAGPAQTRTPTAREPVVVANGTTTPTVSATAAAAGTMASGEAQPAPLPTGADLDVAAGSERAVQLACQDLAGRLGLSLESTQVISVTTVQWPDTLLGCPQAGKAYVQVITPGFRVLLVSQEQVYEYHTDVGQLAVLCQEESMPSTNTSPGHIQPGLERLADQARQDLAHRLSIPAEQIEVLEVKSVVWPDGGLGCPEPGMAYTQVQVEGMLIRLRAGQRTYSYHGGGGTPPFLCEGATTDERPAG